MRFPYNPRFVERIKTIKGRQWHPEGKLWSFPYSKHALDEILAVLAGEEVEIDHSLQENLSAPSPVDQLLDRVRSMIRLKHYSIKTEKSYLPWIKRYLSFYHNRNSLEQAKGSAIDNGQLYEIMPQ